MKALKIYIELRINTNQQSACLGTYSKQIQMQLLLCAYNVHFVCGINKLMNIAFLSY